jgi:hypothetical protein
MESPLFHKEQIQRTFFGGVGQGREATSSAGSRKREAPSKGSFVLMQREEEQDQEEHEQKQEQKVDEQQQVRFCEPVAYLGSVGAYDTYGKTCATR